MNKSESKYFNTAIKMDMALIELLDTKEFEYITVKEICVKAGVNRSTFYLHYENTRDLLAECLDYMNSEFMSYYKENSEMFAAQINELPHEKLMLITHEYVVPYLKFIINNQSLFRAAIKYPQIMESDKKYESLCKHIFFPIMERFHVQSDDMEYIMAFYINGIVAVTQTWLTNGCKESVDKIADIIVNCINR